MPLDEPGCPIAILRAVWAVIVPPFNCQTVRPRAHIRNEVLEALGAAPPLANRDTSAAIILIGFVVLIAATAVHCPPNPMKRGIRFPMLSAGLVHRGGSAASATITAARPQCVPLNRFLPSAIATAKPSRTAADHPVLTEYQKQPVTLASKIDRVGHSNSLTPVAG